MNDFVLIKCLLYKNVQVVGTTQLKKKTKLLSLYPKGKLEKLWANILLVRKSYIQIWYPLLKYKCLRYSEGEKLYVKI